MIVINLFISFVMSIAILAIYITFVNIVSIALMNMNFYLYKKKCNKYFELAMNGYFYREEISKWFEVETKMYNIRYQKIDRYHDRLLMKEREK